MLYSISYDHLAFVYNRQLCVVQLPDMQKVWQIPLSSPVRAVAISHTGWVAWLCYDGTINAQWWKRQSKTDIRSIKLEGISLHNARLAASERDLAIITSNSIHILSLNRLWPKKTFVIAAEPEVIARDDCLAVSSRNERYLFFPSETRRIHTHHKIVGIDREGYIAVINGSAKRMKGEQNVASLTFEGIHLTPCQIACSSDMSAGVGTFFLPPPHQTVVIPILVWNGGQVTSVGITSSPQALVSMVESSACVITPQSVLIWTDGRLEHAISLTSLATGNKALNREITSNIQIDEILRQSKVHVDILQKPWSYILWWESIPISKPMEAWRSLTCGECPILSMKVVSLSQNRSNKEVK